MLRACSEGVDLKVDRYLGEGHRQKALNTPYSVPKNFVNKKLGSCLPGKFQRQPNPIWSEPNPVRTITPQGTAASQYRNAPANRQASGDTGSP